MPPRVRLAQAIKTAPVDGTALSTRTTARPPNASISSRSRSFNGITCDASRGPSVLTAAWTFEPLRCLDSSSLARLDGLVRLSKTTA